MYLSKTIREKMKELMDLISPKITPSTPVAEAKDEVKPEVETALADQKPEVTEPKVDVVLADEPKETPTETKVELVDVPTEEAPAEAPAEEEGMDMEETVKQLVEAITAIDARLKAIEDAIGSKAAEAEAKNAELSKQVDELGQKIAKNNGFKTLLGKNANDANDYYAQIKNKFNK